MSDGARPLCVALRPIFLTMVALDPRINPFRPEIAAKYLQGQVEAERFVEGTHHQVIEPVTALRRAPSHEASARHRSAAGRARDRFTKRPRKAGPGASWKLTAMSAGCRRTRSDRAAPAPTHKVAVLRAFAFPGPDIKLPPDRRATDGRAARHRAAG